MREFFKRQIEKLKGSFHRETSAPQTQTLVGDTGAEKRAEVKAEQPPVPALPRTRMELERFCCQLGFDTARASWPLSPDPVVLKALEGEAEGIASAMVRPKSDAATKRKLDRLGAVESPRARRVDERDRAAQRIAEEERRLASMGPRRPFPGVSALFRYAAIIALTISIAPTLHDQLVGLDAFMKWFAGGLCAFGIALFLVHGILPQPPDKDS